MTKKTKTRYGITWESNTQPTRKVGYFSSLERAEAWYDEKLAEGKNPKLWKEETTTTFEALRLHGDD